MFKDNIINLRNIHDFSQEEVAEKIGISRQAYAKWEKGETVPDIEKCSLLANLYNTSLDQLYASYENIEGLDGQVVPGPKGRHIFGTVTMNEKGQIVIPKKARDIMGYKPGEDFLILGDESSGLAIMRTKDFLKSAISALKAAKEKAD